MINAPPKTPPTIAPTGAGFEDEVELAAGGLAVEKGKKTDMMPVGDVAVIREVVEVEDDAALLGKDIEVVKTSPTGFVPSPAVNTTVWVRGDSPQYQAVPRNSLVLRTYWLQYGEVDAHRMIFGSTAHALSQFAINDAGRHDVGSGHEEDVEQQPNTA